MDCELRNKHEREFLALIKRSQRLPELPTVRDPDQHIDAPGGLFHFGDMYFDFAWGAEALLLDLDGERDDWKTLEAQALGWTVCNIDYSMLQVDPLRVLRALQMLLGCEAGTLGTLLDDEAREDQALLDGEEDTLCFARRVLDERISNADAGLTVLELLDAEAVPAVVTPLDAAVTPLRYAVQELRERCAALEQLHAEDLDVQYALKARWAEDADEALQTLRSAVRQAAGGGRT